MNWILSLFSGLVGAIFGALATYYGNRNIELQRVRRLEAERRANLRVSIKLEFDGCLKCLNEMKSGMAEKRMYPLRWTNVLQRSAQTLSNLKLELHILKDISLQEKLVALVVDLDLFASDVSGLENMWVDRVKGQLPFDVQDDWFKENRQLQLADLVDLKRRVEEISRELS